MNIKQDFGCLLFIKKSPEILKFYSQSRSKLKLKFSRYTKLFQIYINTSADVSKSKLALLTFLTASSLEMREL